MMAGAAIGKALRRPWLALPAAFASHLLLDVTPHLDSHALFGADGTGPTRPVVALTALDILLGIVLVLWAVGRQPGRRLMLWAAFLAVVIDLVDNVPPWNAWFRAWPVGARISSLHHGIQHNVTPAEWPLGVGTQIALVAAALWVLRLVPHRETADRGRELHEG